MGWGLVSASEASLVLSFLFSLSLSFPPNHNPPPTPAYTLIHPQTHPPKVTQQFQSSPSLPPALRVSLDDCSTSRPHRRQLFPPLPPSFPIRKHSWDIRH
ncbi:hypothetical protein BDY24DRAFT_400923 [Mrakia frigida]|uniref:uncharacterized protein n=1 Tax=Mrakia frigida TaxID=29902 RepID=UPI003FCC009B